MKLINKGKTLEQAALGSDMTAKTARKYVRSGGKMPEELKSERTHRTRKDPFQDTWDEIEELLRKSPGLEAKTIFRFLQEKYPGKLQDGQLRTLQRRIRQWKVTDGPEKTVYFDQEHYPGDLSASDFTNMNELNITIQNKPFKHLLYHFVLTYSNWQAGTICHSESFESLSEGLQNALWRLGGVPKRHRTDRLTAAVNNLKGGDVFQKRYTELLEHYGLQGERTNPYSGNENGDVEQSHNRFKKRLHQELLLRGSRDFNSEEEYNHYIQNIFVKMNKGCAERYRKEEPALSVLPVRRLESYRTEYHRVRRSATIHVSHTTYSVPSQLIGEKVEVRLYGSHLEIRVNNRQIEQIPRQKGGNSHYIQYRHIIHSLVRKPGAFRSYKFHKDLFPTSNFRIAYDTLNRQFASLKADRQYVKILEMAAMESEDRVNNILAVLIRKDECITADTVRSLLKIPQKEDIVEIGIAAANLESYDSLIYSGESV